MRRKKKLQPTEITITITFGSHFCGLVKTGPNSLKQREVFLWTVFLAVHREPARIPSKLEEKPWHTLTYFESRVLD